MIDRDPVNGSDYTNFTIDQLFNLVYEFQTQVYENYQQPAEGQSPAEVVEQVPEVVETRVEVKQVEVPSVVVNEIVEHKIKEVAQPKQNALRRTYSDIMIDDADSEVPAP